MKNILFFVHCFFPYAGAYKTSSEDEKYKISKDLVFLIFLSKVLLHIIPIKYCYTGIRNIKRTIL